MDPDTQGNAVSAVTGSEAASAPDASTVAQLQAQIAALKAKAALEVASASASVASSTAEVATATAKVAKQVAKKAKAKAEKGTKSVKKATKKAATKKAKKDVKSDAPVCTFEECGRKQIAKGLCPSHYRQQRRGAALTALRPLRGLVRLPMVIRVEQETFDTLEKRVKSGQANSMYDATRQALEAGIATWGK